MERREVLSGVIPFATLTGQVSTPGQPVQLVLHLAANQVTTTHAKPVLLGFYAETPSGSTVNPAITEVDGTNGLGLAPLSLPRHGNTVAPKTLFLTDYLPIAGQAQDITVNVAGLDASTGNVVVQAFLPGDVNGDRVVDASDLTRVKAAYGSAIGQANYDPQADFNGDGHIGCVDRRLTELNQGATIGAFPVTTSAVVPVAATSVTVTTPTVAAVTTTPIVATSVPVATTTVPVVYTTQPVAAATTQTTTVSSPTTVTIPTAQASTVAYVPTSTTTPTYVVAQPVVQGTSTSTATTPTYVVAQPVVQGTSTSTSTSGPVYVVAQGSGVTTGQTTPTGPVYVLYPTTMQAPATVATTSTVAATVPTATVVPTTTTVVTTPTATSTTAAVPTSSYQPGESGPVYYYGQAVVQAPTSSQTFMAGTVG